MKVALHLEGRAVHGSERQALLIARGLRGRGHDVVASCRATGPVRRALEEAGVRTTGVRPRGDVDVVSALRFAMWLRRERPDALLLTSWKRVRVAGWAARVGRVPRVVMRMGGFHAAGHDLSGRLQRHAFTRWYDAIVANSGTVRDHVLADLPQFPAASVHVIPNAVEPVRAEPGPIRAELGLAPASVLLLAVGGLVHLKGHDLLVRALASLDPAVHLAIAGGGSEDQRGVVERTGRDAGVAGRVHLLGHRDDVPALLGAADAFVHASRTDSLPNALLEAMSAGLPVVSTAVGGVPDALAAKPGAPPAGWVVPREDAAALAAALAEVVRGLRSGDPGVAERRAEARRRAGRCFGVDRMIQAYEAVLR